MTTSKATLPDTGAQCSLRISPSHSHAGVYYTITSFDNLNLYCIAAHSPYRTGFLTVMNIMKVFVSSNLLLTIMSFLIYSKN